MRLPSGRRRAGHRDPRCSFACRWRWAEERYIGDRVAIERAVNDGWSAYFGTARVGHAVTGTVFATARQRFGAMVPKPRRWLSYAEVRDGVPEHLHLHFHLLTPHRYQARDPMFSSLWRLALGVDHDGRAGVQVEATRDVDPAARYACGYVADKRRRPLFRPKRECGFELACGTPLFPVGLSYRARRVERELRKDALDRFFPTALEADFADSLAAAAADRDHRLDEWAATEAQQTSE